nr:zinc finger protein 518A-like [Nerophis lumbriciformis]
MTFVVESTIDGKRKGDCCLAVHHTPCCCCKREVHEAGVAYPNPDKISASETDVDDFLPAYFRSATTDEDSRLLYCPTHFNMSSVDDAKDSPHLKEKALLSEGKPSESPVKQHGFTRRASCKIQQRAFFSGNILSFGCSVCKDDWTYSPNDLLKHFQLSHRGILPTYPCDLCGFFTNEFASLQRHRMEHKNPLVTCELCSDGHQYSLLLLTRHLVVRHSRNGKFRCNWCDFTTVDAGTFVQHIHHHNESPWKCPQCQHISLNEVDHQEHLKAHTLLHFICQICGYCSTTMNHLKRHAFCHNQQIHTNRQEMQTVPKLIGIPVILPNQNGRMKSEMRLEHSNQIVDSTTAKKDNLTVEQSPPALSLDNGGSQSNHNALTVLMVKNKISLPPNCTTKAMGFKVVDGKKHLVLKVIPVAKQNACPQDSSSVGIFDSSATSSEFFKHRDLDENSEQSAVESATSHCFAAPLGSGSCVPTEDIVAVKVKIEEEETSVFTLESPFHGDDFGAKCEEVECPATDDENTDLVLEDFNVVKVEEELIPLSNNSQDKKSTSSVLDSFMEQHADAIITQLRKERIESSLSDDSSEQTESIVQNLKVQDEMQREVLKNNEQTLAQPMQIKATPSFQLITSCVNPQINVSYMKSRLVSERSPTGRTVLPKESNIGSLKPGASDKITLGSSTQTSISPHFLINSPNLKGSVLLSSKPLNNSKEKVPQTCYLVPRSIPLVQAPTSSVLMQASAKLNSRPVLSTPADKSHQMQTGRQTFLLRYISTPKSSILFNHQEIKSVPQSCHTWEKRANKVVYKIVRPPMSMLKSDPPSSSSHPLVLTNSPETQCVLMSSNKTNPNLSNNLEKIISQPNTAPNVPEPTPLLIKVSDGDRPRLAPRPIRPPSGRKIRRKVLFDELTTTAHKARRVANKVQTEKDTTVCWSPVSKEVERTLRLAPYNCLQQIKCPRRYQPVVVLNHPDADIPEVANIMKVIHRHRGAVAKVSLSQKTVKALAELGTLGGEMMTKDVLLQSKVPSPRAVQSSVRERFLLKLKLKKKSKKKYQVVEPLSRSRKKTVMFDCWFCGRLFSSQEQWIGHGQRHLMEATRDWNKLF